MKVKLPVVVSNMNGITFLNRNIFLRELFLWVLGVGLLGLMDPEGNHLFSFCPFSWALDNFCPGCGLGHAIAFLFRGELTASWESHPLGVPALAILVYRCGHLLRQHIKLNQL